MNRQMLFLCGLTAVFSVSAGTYTENANTIKQIASPGGTDNCVTNGTAWAGGIAPNLNQAGTPSNPAAVGKEFFTPSSHTFRTLKDPPTSWGTLVIEHPIHIAGRLTPAAKFDRQPMTFKSLSLYDNAQLVDNANVELKDSAIKIRSGTAKPLTITGGNNINARISNCTISGVSEAGMKIACGSSGPFVFRTDDSFGEYKGKILVGIGEDAAFDTKFRLTANFNCPGDILARNRGFFTVLEGVQSTINVRRLELVGGTLELTAGSYATFTNLVFTAKPYKGYSISTFAPNDATRPVVTVLDSVSVAEAAKPYPIKCAYTANSSVLASYPLIRAKGVLNASDFTLQSTPKAGSVLGTTFDSETGFTTLWIHESVSLKSNDSGYDSSFTNSVRWADGQAPHADADYFVPAGKNLRTPKDYKGGAMEFGGRSLYLGGEFQTATRWSFEEVVYKNGLVVIPEFHVLDGSKWVLNCDAGLSNTTMIVESTATPFNVDYRAKADDATIACVDIALKGSATSKMSFTSTLPKWTTFYLKGTADGFFGTCAFSTNYTFEIIGDLTSPGSFTFGAKSKLRVKDGTATLGTVSLASDGAIEFGVKEVDGVETPSGLVVTTALTAPSPLRISLPLTKGVDARVETDLLTIPTPATPLTLNDFRIEGVNQKANATFEVVTEGAVQKLHLIRQPRGFALIVR